MKCVVEPGEFEIMVGNSSRDTDLQKVILTVAQ
jgi:beta-glucosidase